MSLKLRINKLQECCACSSETMIKQSHTNSSLAYNSVKFYSVILVLCWAKVDVLSPFFNLCINFDMFMPLL